MRTYIETEIIVFLLVEYILGSESCQVKQLSHPHFCSVYKYLEDLFIIKLLLAINFCKETIFCLPFGGLLLY